MHSLPYKHVSLLILLLGAGCGEPDKGADGGSTVDPNDRDGDGYGADEDCNDNNPDVNPGATEICNHINDDCDDEVDEDVMGLWWADSDGDGYGRENTTAVESCDQPAGYVAQEGDCDDTNAEVNPDAIEACNNIDDNCDGVADDGTTLYWYADADSDGYGDPDTETEACEPPSGMISDGTDCDDHDATVNPGAEEVCGDYDDDDCDGHADVGVTGTWYTDSDGDGYGHPAQVYETCDPEPGWVQEGGDCRPSEADKYPGAPEACNDDDDDCDGEIDEDFDKDGDGGQSTECTLGTDCDDADPTIYMGAQEICGDGIDQSCDGADRSCSYSGSFPLGSADAKLWGPTSNYDSGRQVDAGDVTGDGKDDIIIATLYANSYNGGAFVIPGPITGSMSLSSAGFYLKGSTPTYGGGRSVGTFDVSGDGMGDVLVGGPWASAPSAWITFGPITANANLEDADVQLIGSASTYTSHGCDLGDVNGDGEGDAIIGAYYATGTVANSGKAFVVYGPLSSGSALTLESDSDSEISATRTSAYFGRWVQAGRDMDGDGIGDMLIAAPYESVSASSAGTAYIIHGPPDATMTTASADGIWYGEAASNYAAQDIGLGDINGDGLTDALVGAAYNSSGASYGGAAYVIYGPGTGTASLGTADIIIRGTHASQYFGSAAQGGDVDGDGIEELAVGATGDTTSGTAAGSVFVFNLLVAGTYTASDADAVLIGETNGDYLGEGVAFGDLDGDHLKELILGAPSEDKGGSSSGSVYVQYPY